MNLSVRFDASSFHALNAYSKVALASSKVLERMGTGLRINRASDDAAGLAVSENLRAQARGAAVARRNIQDAVSVFTIQDGIVAQTTAILQRMRELTIQASSDTLSSNERIYLNTEAKALLEEVDRLAARKAMNNTFAMDGSFGSGERITDTANEALDALGSIILTNANIASSLFESLLEVEVIQQSVAQTFKDASIRSAHIQETLTSFLDSVLVSTTTITGTASGNRNDSSIVLTAPVDQSPDSLIQLVRSHDGGIVTLPYGVVGGPAAHSSTFTVSINTPNATNGALYSVSGEAATSDGGGAVSIGDTVVEKVTRVQANKFMDRSLSDGDGVVGLSRGDIVSIESVVARNYSEQILNDADGTLVLSRNDAASIDRIEAKNSSEQILADGDGAMVLSRADINAIDKIQTKNWSEQLNTAANGLATLGRSDANAMDEVQAKSWSDRFTNDADGLMNLSRADVADILDVVAKNYSEHFSADADGAVVLSRTDAASIDKIQTRNWSDQFSADADGLVSLSRTDATAINKVETHKFSEEVVADADGVVTLSRTDATALDRVRSKNFSDQTLADADGAVTLSQPTANGIDSVETRNTSERWLGQTDGNVTLARTDATAIDAVETKNVSERFISGADGAVALSRADVTAIERVRARTTTDRYAGDADGTVALSRTDAVGIDSVETRNFSERFMADADGVVVLSRTDATGINQIQAKNNSDLSVADVNGAVVLSRTDAVAIASVEAQNFSERWLSDADGAVVLSRTDATGMDRIEAKSWSEQFSADADGVVTLSRTDATAIEQIETHSFSERFAADADGAVTLSRVDATGINRIRSKNSSELFTSDADGSVVLARSDVTALSSLEARSFSERFVADADGTVVLTRTDATGMERVQAKSWSEQFSADADGVVTLSRTDATAISQIEVWDGAAWNSVRQWDDPLAVAGDTVYKWDGAQELVVGELQADMTTLSPLAAPYTIGASYATSDWIELQSQATGAIGETVYQWDGATGLSVGRLNSGGTLDALGPYDIEAAYSTTDFVSLTDKASGAAGDMVYEWDGATGITVGVLQDDATIAAAGSSDIWAAYQTADWVTLAESGSATTGATVYQWDGSTGITVGKLAADGTVEAAGPYTIETSYDVSDWVALTKKSSANAGDTVYEWDGATALTVGVLADDGTIEDTTTHDVWASYATSDWVTLSNSSSAAVGQTVYAWDGATGLSVGRLTAGATIEPIGSYDIQAAYSTAGFVSLSDIASGSVGDTVYEWDGASGLTIGVLQDDNTLSAAGTNAVWTAYQTAGWVTLAEKGAAATGDTVYEWDGATGLTVGKLAADGTMSAAGPYTIESSYSISDWVTIGEKSTAAAGDTVYEWNGTTGLTVGVLEDDGTITDTGTHDIQTIYDTADWVTLAEKSSGSTGDTVYEWDGASGLTVGKLAADGTLQAAGPYAIETAYQTANWVGIAEKSTASAGDTVYAWDGADGLTVGLLNDDGTIADAGTYDLQAAYATAGWQGIVEKNSAAAGDTVYEWNGSTGINVGRLKDDGTLEAIAPYDVWTAYSTTDWITLAQSGVATPGATAYAWDGATGLTVGKLAADGTLSAAGSYTIDTAYTTSGWVEVAQKAAGSSGDTVYQWDGADGIQVGQLDENGIINATGSYDIRTSYATANWITLSEKAVGATGDTVYAWDGATGLRVGALADDGTIQSGGPYDISAAYAIDNFASLTEKASGAVGETVYEWDGASGLSVGKLNAGGTLDAVSQYTVIAAYETADWVTLTDSTSGSTGDTVYAWDGSTGLRVGWLDDDGTTISASAPLAVTAAYATDNWVTLDESASGTTGETVYEWDGSSELRVGKLADDGTLQAVGPYDTWAAYSTDNWVTLNERGSAAAGETVYEWNGSNRVTIGKLDADNSLSAAGPYDGWASYATANWTPLREKSAGAVGETVYEWDGANSISVGKLTASNTLEAVPDYDVTALYTISGSVDISSLAASTTDQEVVYGFTPGTNTVTIGRRNGGAIASLGVVDAVVDYQAWEDEYSLTYDSYNKFQMSGAGATTSGGEIQFATDQYAGSNVPSDNNGFAALEVRVNGAATGNYTHHDAYGGLNNVLVFDSAPTAGATISVDYTTPRGDAVDWSSAATMGEDTTSDGTISAGESSSKDGVFNDFFSSHTQDTITISQPNRGVSMTLAVNPTWTINQFIDEFNIEAQVSDVEAEAYWDGTAGEVRIRPGTSGWKTRDITGWAGEYFKLEGAVVSPNATNLGGGSSGAQATAQNRFSIEETTAAVGSRIIVRTADGTVLADSTSDWNHHDLTNLGFSLDVLESATVGATSQFFVQAAQLQIGGGADDANRMYLHMPDIRARSLDIESVDLRRQPLAVSALNKIDNAISSANGFRAYFGSQINNLTHQMDAITVFEHNTTAAESQIRDVDFAQASAELSRTQLLIQSSLAMVAQGNMSRQSVLQLLDF